VLDDRKEDFKRVDRLMDGMLDLAKQVGVEVKI
jgi:hypothetical protein